VGVKILSPPDSGEKKGVECRSLLLSRGRIHSPGPRRAIHLLVNRRALYPKLGHLLGRGSRWIVVSERWEVGQRDHVFPGLGPSVGASIPVGICGGTGIVRLVSPRARVAAHGSTVILPDGQARIRDKKLAIPPGTGPGEEPWLPHRFAWLRCRSRHRETTVER
jgi:hypothetical protein